VVSVRMQAVAVVEQIAVAVEVGEQTVVVVAAGKTEVAVVVVAVERTGVSAEVVEVERQVAVVVEDEQEEGQSGHPDHHLWRSLAKQFALLSIEIKVFAEAEQIAVAAGEQIVAVAEVGIAVVVVEQTV